MPKVVDKCILVNFGEETGAKVHLTSTWDRTLCGREVTNYTSWAPKDAVVTCATCARKEQA